MIKTIEIISFSGCLQLRLRYMCVHVFNFVSCCKTRLSVSTFSYEACTCVSFSYSFGWGYMVNSEWMERIINFSWIHGSYSPHYNYIILKGDVKCKKKRKKERMLKTQKRYCKNSYERKLKNEKFQLLDYYLMNSKNKNESKRIGQLIIMFNRLVKNASGDNKKQFPGGRATQGEVEPNHISMRHPFRCHEGVRRGRQGRADLSRERKRNCCK